MLAPAHPQTAPARGKGDAAQDGADSARGMGAQDNRTTKQARTTSGDTSLIGFALTVSPLSCSSERSGA